MVERILAAFRAGDSAEAVRLSREAIAADDIAEHWHLLSMSLRAAGDHAAALEAIDAAINRAPEASTLHFARAGHLAGTESLATGSPNVAREITNQQLQAYLVRVLVEIDKGDIAAAEVIRHQAAASLPGHARGALIDGTMLLRDNQVERAVKILAASAQAAPNDVQVQYLLGFAYMQSGLWAFAEQVFRKLQVADAPSLRYLRLLVAQLLARQSRADEAAEEVTALLAESGKLPPAILGFAGELQLRGGDTAAGIANLKKALAMNPGDARTIGALSEAWRPGDQRADARATLDAALAITSGSDHLWRARTAIEGGHSPEALALAEKWVSAMPDNLPGLQTLVTLYDINGRSDDAEATAQRMLAVQPDHQAAHRRLLDGLLKRDPEQAVAYVDALVAGATDPEDRRAQRAWRGVVLDAAARYGEAVDEWTRLHAEVADQRLPLPPDSSDIPLPAEWSPMLPEGPRRTLFLWGAPGSGIERVAGVFARTHPTFRDDRFGANPPPDAFQNFTTLARLNAGQASSGQVIESWRRLLPQRQIANEQVVDWLIWWDNAFLDGLRRYLPAAGLLLAVRDPRDMLLEWLAFGAMPAYQLPSPRAGAEYLARIMGEIVELHARDAFPHQLLRLDALGQQPELATAVLAEALGVEIPAVPSADPPRFAPGRWRPYATALEGEFALLHDVAVALGYPAA